MPQAKSKSKPLTLQRQDKGKHLVWSIVLAGKSVKLAWGERYAKQREKTHTLASPALAKAKHDALVAEKRAEGYRGVRELDEPTVPIVRDATLEAAIREHREDPAPYLVYADWLQAKGCPLGELIVLAHANKHKRAAAIAAQIGLPTPDIATYGWRDGFWQWLRLENDADWMDNAFEPLPIVSRLFASPLCAVLEDLRIGILRWDYNDQPAVIAEAGRHAWAHDLARLHVGDVPDNIDMDHHTIGDVGKAITKSFPNLRRLKLHSGSQTWRGGKETFGFAGLELPVLEELVIETCAMTSKRMKALAAAKLPALERLEVWFGARERGATAKAADITAVFDGKLFPKLRHLGLRNSELVTDIVRLLPSSRLAKQLESLDLSMGTMSDSDASELAAEAKALGKLARLDVGASYLTKAGVRTLKTAFPGVAIASADMKEPYDFDPDSRYVSVEE